MNYEMLLSHIYHGLVFNFSYLRKFNKDWSKTLGHLLDMVDDGKASVSATENIFDGKVHCLDISFNGVEYSIWVSSKQFSYAYLYRINGETIDESSQFRPSIWVMMRLSDLFDKIEDGKKNKDLIIDFGEIRKGIEK